MVWVSRFGAKMPVRRKDGGEPAVDGRQDVGLAEVDVAECGRSPNRCGAEDDRER
jgi:hypothetical protein